MVLSEQIIKIFQDNQIQCTQQQQSTIIAKLISLIKSKDTIIRSLEQQVTKYKCEALTNNKNVLILQQKLNKLLPNNNNTASNFMLSSQFKDKFHNFMKNQLSITFSILIENSKLYFQMIWLLFNNQYKYIQSMINKMIQSVGQLLNIQSENFDQLFLSLLRILQDNNQHLLPFQNIKPDITNIKIKSQLKDQILQLFQGQQYETMLQELHKLCIYMLLQQKKWQFIEIKEMKICQYNKKQHTCIDGFVKQKQKVAIILEGIIKDNHVHPNLKNYVIPFIQLSQEQEQQQNQEVIQQKPLLRQSHINKINHVQNLANKQFIENSKRKQQKQQTKNDLQNKNKNDKVQFVQIDFQTHKKSLSIQQKQIVPAIPKSNITFHQLLNPRTPIIRNNVPISTNGQKSKSPFQESYIYTFKQKSRTPNKVYETYKQEKKKIISETQLNANIKLKQKHDSSFESHTICPMKSYDERVSKYKQNDDFFTYSPINMKKQKNVLQSRQHERIVKYSDELSNEQNKYMNVIDSYQSNKNKHHKKNRLNGGLIADPSIDDSIPNIPKDRVKKTRKNSVGKIINQIQKQNIFSKGNKIKEKLYKEIIKDKLMEQPMLKIKTDRGAKKSQNRPLKITNVNKLRDKYLY